jgi:hypothetical protein
LKTLLQESGAWYNHKRRKPILQIKILRLIANKGRLAICEAESSLKGQHFHNEIWESFNILKKKGLIKKMPDRNPGPGKLIGKGLPRNYHAVTEKGLVALIKEGLEPKDFWNYLIDYSSAEPKLDRRLDIIEDIYELFLQKYLKYSSGFDYNVIFQLDQFNKMCKHWITKNTSNDSITLEQKVLEILAVAGSSDGMTIEEISENCREEPEKVRKLLWQYTPTYHQGSFLMEEDVYLDNNALERELVDIVMRNIITTQTINGVKKYSLSLFGIMLVLTLVRYHNMNRLDLYLLGNHSIQEAFDIVASNYKNKLPLIFGQWFTLKDILKIISVYNFDVIIDRESRLMSVQTSVNMKGNKEFYHGNEGVTMYNRKQMMDLYDAGISVITNVHSKVDDKENIQYWDNPKTIGVYKKLVEIGVLLGYHYDRSHNEENVPTTWMLERSFAYEITFLYYLNLNSDTYVPLLLPQNDYFPMFADDLLSKITSNKFQSEQANEYSVAQQTSKITPISPRERLVAILKQNKPVNEWFSNCILNSLKFTSAADEIMSSFYKEIS